MRQARLSGWRRLTEQHEPFEFVASDGRVLAAVPFSLALPASEQHLRSYRSLAQIVVSQCPERFGLLRPSHPFGAFLTFGPVKESLSRVEIDWIVRRDQLLKRALYGFLFLTSVVGFIYVTWWH